MVDAKLDLFKMSPTDISTSSYRMAPIQPFTTGTTPIDFQVDAQGDFEDLNRSYFDLELQLSSTDNNNLARTAHDTDTMISIVKNFAHFVVKQINTRLNGTLISEQTDTYHYKACMETLLNNNRKYGETILVPQGWYNHIDVVSQYKVANIKNDDAQHAALSQQHKNTLKAKKDALVPLVAQRRHTLRIKPHLEPFMMGKLLVPGVQFSIQFYMNAPELIFEAVTIQGKIREIKMKMYLCVVRLNDTIFRSLMSKMTTQKQIVKYPTVRSEIATRSFRQGERILEIQNPFQSRIPNFIMAALVNTAAFNGAYDRDPFCFEKSRVTTFKQFIRGEEYPYETMDLNYNNRQKD